MMYSPDYKGVDTEQASLPCLPACLAAGPPGCLAGCCCYRLRLRLRLLLLLLLLLAGWLRLRLLRPAGWLAGCCLLPARRCR
jgi:hypothetical protein